MLLPSTGFTCAIFCSNDGTLTSGTRMTVPLRVFGSICCIRRSTAMIDAYSVPCAPETIASTGPGRAPLKTATGIDSAASDPAGTSMVPRAICPRGAAAVPTRTSCASTAANSSVSIRTFYHGCRRDGPAATLRHKDHKERQDRKDDQFVFVICVDVVIVVLGRRRRPSVLVTYHRGEAYSFPVA